MSDPTTKAIETALRIGLEAYELLKGGLSEAEVRERLAQNKAAINRELDENERVIREGRR